MEARSPLLGKDGSLLSTTNGSAELSAWKKMDVFLDLKTGFLPGT